MEQKPKISNKNQAKIYIRKNYHFYSSLSLKTNNLTLYRWTSTMGIVTNFLIGVRYSINKNIK